MQKTIQRFKVDKSYNHTTFTVNNYRKVRVQDTEEFVSEIMEIKSVKSLEMNCSNMLVFYAKGKIYEDKIDIFAGVVKETIESLIEGKIVLWYYTHEEGDYITFQFVCFDFFVNPEDAILVFRKVCPEAEFQRHKTFNFSPKKEFIKLDEEYKIESDDEEEEVDLDIRVD